MAKTFLLEESKKGVETTKHKNSMGWYSLKNCKNPVPYQLSTLQLSSESSLHIRKLCLDPTALTDGIIKVDRNIHAVRTQITTLLNRVTSLLRNRVIWIPIAESVQSSELLSKTYARWFLCALSDLFTIYDLMFFKVFFRLCSSKNIVFFLRG